MSSYLTPLLVALGGALGALTRYTVTLLAASFLVTGFLGGLTTFSSMMNEIMQFFLAGHLLEGCAYLLSQLLIGLLAVFAGYLLMSRISL